MSSETRPKVTKQSFFDLLYVVRKVCKDAWKEHRKYFVLIIVASIITALIPFVVRGSEALLINKLVTVFGTGIVDTTIIVLLIFLTLSFFARDASLIWMEYLRKTSWFDFTSKYESRFSEKLAHLDVATHENPKFQDELQIVREKGEAFAVANFIESFGMNFQNIIGFIAASTVVIIADWRLFLLIVVVSVPRFYYELKYGEGIWSIYQSESENRRFFGELKRHTAHVTSIRELQTFQTVPYFIRHLKRLLRDYFKAQEREERSKFVSLISSQVLIALALGITFYVLLLRVINGETEIGTFTFFISSILSLQDAVAGFFLGIATQHRESRTVKAFFEIMQKERHINSPIGGVKLEASKAPVIEFDHVSFGYPTSPEGLVLKDFSLRIESGEKLAFVGVNGAGKSTLIKLLCRFYDPIQGRILINGVDLREMDLESWYSNLALLAQDYETYKFKTWEVINLGRLSKNRDQQKVEHAAERAQASSFIEEWKEKYDQQIGVEFSGGVEPSGGQKQKLSLARTMFRDACVTILDEPTSNVDAEAEKIFFERLEKEIKKDQTLILVSHRFSTVRSADRICVIKDGKVHELGSHAELIALNGTYAKLFESQASKYR